MAAGLGFKTFTSGEVLTAADTNGYLMQGVMVFASASARSAAITAPTEGQYSYLKDTNSTEYYDGSAWVAGVEGDISGVTAGTGISGGGTSGTVTVTNSMATTITTKGDLVPGTGSGTFARLAVGNNGETLVADSSTSTGLRYQGHIEAGKNALINGGMDIWQRGTSSTTSLAYIADRWFQYTSAGTTTFSRESTIVPTGSTYSMKISQASASATITVNQAIETLNAIQFAGQTVSVSMMCYASASTGMQMQVQYSTSTDVGPLGTWTSITASSGGAATVTNAWQKMTGIYAIPSTAKSLYISLFIPTLTATTNAYFGQAMLELGSVPTQFSRAGGTIQGELAACQRYYYRNNSGGSSTFFAGGIGAYSTTNAICSVVLPVPMRVTPNAIDSSGTASHYRLYNGIRNLALSVVPTIGADSSPTTVQLIATVTTGLTVGDVASLIGNSSTSAYIGLGAEL